MDWFKIEGIGRDYVDKSGNDDFIDNDGHYDDATVARDSDIYDAGNVHNGQKPYGRAV